MRPYIISLTILISIFSLSIKAQTQWEWQNPIPQRNYLQDVCFVDADNGWVVGENGTILATSDGGNNWNAQTSGIFTGLSCVYFTVNYLQAGDSEAGSG